MVRGLVFAVLCFAWMLAGAPKSEAALFTPSIPNVVDFGNVPLGESSTIRWSLGYPRDLAMAGTPDYTTGAFQIKLITDCYCTWDITFTPEILGMVSASVLMLVISFPPPEHGVADVYFIDLQGNGIDPATVPIPAALPLLSFVLAALGFIGWRRKRHAVH